MASPSRKPCRVVKMTKPAEMVLWQCDQCAFEEWRPADQEPWLCAACGYFRWRALAIATAEEPSPDEGNEAGDQAD